MVMSFAAALLFKDRRISTILGLESSKSSRNCAKCTYVNYVQWDAELYYANQKFLHSTMWYFVHCTLYSAYPVTSTLYTVQCTEYSVLCIVYCLTGMPSEINQYLNTKWYACRALADLGEMYVLVSHDTKTLEH